MAGGCDGVPACAPARSLMMPEQLFIFWPPRFKGGRANGSQASIRLTLFEELAAGLPLAQYSLLLHARPSVHAPTHNSKHCSGPAPRVALVLVSKRGMKAASDAKLGQAISDRCD